MDGTCGPRSTSGDYPDGPDFLDEYWRLPGPRKEAAQQWVKMAAIEEEERTRGDAFVPLWVRITVIEREEPTEGRGRGIAVTYWRRREARRTKSPGTTEETRSPRKKPRQERNRNYRRPKGIVFSASLPLELPLPLPLSHPTLCRPLTCGWSACRCMCTGSP